MNTPRPHTQPHTHLHSPLHITAYAAQSERIRAIRVLVQCGDPLVRAGLRSALEDSPEFELLPPLPLPLPLPMSISMPRPGGIDGEAAPTVDARADIVVADYEQGLALVARARDGARLQPSRLPHVLIVTPRENECDIRQALELGVRGYLSLGCELEEVLEAVRALHAGVRHIGARVARRLADSVGYTALTSRETDVVRLVAQGRCNKVVANELKISEGTVKSHMKAIFEKLGAKSRTEVAMLAQQRGLLGAFASPLTERVAKPVATRPQMLHMNYHALPMLGSAIN